jgi:hypothetical protein
MQMLEHDEACLRVIVSKLKRLSRHRLSTAFCLRVDSAKVQPSRAQLHTRAVSSARETQAESGSVVYLALDQVFADLLARAGLEADVNIVALSDANATLMS